MVGGSGRTFVSATDNSLTTSSIPDQRSSLSPENVDPLWLPLSSCSFHGPKTMMNFETINGGPNPAETPAPFLLQQPETKAETMEEDYINDGLFLQGTPGKKRRLSPNQVHFLEKTFEGENKLDPERKAQLAKELGLQPRQVAIWFQNRRARYKTKQLEKDYEALKANYDNLKVDCDNLVKEKEKLKQELLSLKERLHKGQRDEHISDPIEAINVSTNANNQESIVKELAETVSNMPTVECKPETASSTKSDILDSENPWIEPANSSHIFEPDYSDFSQEEADDLSKKYLPLQYLPRLEDETANSCKFGLLHEDRHFWTWP